MSEGAEGSTADTGQVSNTAGEETQAKESVFRPVFKELSQEKKDQMLAIKVKAEELHKLYEELEPARYTSLAKTELEASVMWAVKQVTI